MSGTAHDLKFLTFSIIHGIFFYFFVIAEPHARFQENIMGANGGEMPEIHHGFAGRRRNVHTRRQHAKMKSTELSAPPDKDPVMLLNEFGQKRDQLVSWDIYFYFYHD